MTKDEIYSITVQIFLILKSPGRKKIELKICECQVKTKDKNEKKKKKFNMLLLFLRFLIKSP